MSFKSSIKYSPNFNPKKRIFKKIKFIIFHYTGMKKESDALNRLTDIQSEVSSHYLIKNSGEIIKLVPELYTAWHAGISSWKNYEYLNKDSIGIEISNQGHDFNYKKFSKEQIRSIVKLTNYLIKKYKIKPQNILGHSDIAPERKKDPGEKFPWQYLSKYKIGLWHKLDQKKLVNYRFLKTNNSEIKLFLKNLFKIGYSKNTQKKSNINKLEYIKIITEAFQRRFRQDQINGIIDQECLMISKNVVKNQK